MDFKRSFLGVSLEKPPQGRAAKIQFLAMQVSRVSVRRMQCLNDTVETSQGSLPKARSPRKDERAEMNSAWHVVNARAKQGCDTRSLLNAQPGWRMLSAEVAQLRNAVPYRYAEATLLPILSCATTLLRSCALRLT